MPYPFVNEPARLQALHEIKILDTPAEAPLDRLVQAAKELFDVPYALITFIDSNRAWIKAGWDINFCEAEREHAICNYTILHDSVLVVTDTYQSKEFRGNPFVQGEPYLRFYAGAPLTLAPDIRVGALCLLDTKPRTFDARQTQDLLNLARIVVGELWLRNMTRSKSGILHFTGEAHGPGFDFSTTMIVSSVQVRAARALLGWTITDLAKAAQVSINTVKRLEDREDNNVSRGTCNPRVRLTFEGSGVTFIGQSGVALSSQNPG